MRINTALTKVLGPVVLALAFAAGLGYGHGPNASLGKARPLRAAPPAATKPHS